MKVIILAGGLGTRLRERVSDLPKVLAPIGGRPFLSVLLDELQGNGISQAILSIGYLGETIRSTYGHEYAGLKISYVQESKPLGTGGALVNAFKQLEHDDYIVLNGDTFLQIDYIDLFNHHINSKRKITMTLREVDDCSRYGAIQVNNATVVKFLEKSFAGKGFINAGVYVLNSAVFANYKLPEVFSFEADFLGQQLESLKPSAYVTKGYFIDIGIPEDYDRAQTELVRYLRENGS